MVTYRVPVMIKGWAVVSYPDGKGVGDYMGGLPRDAEQEVRMQPAPLVCGARLENFSIELQGPAELKSLEEARPHPATPDRVGGPALKKSTLYATE